MKRVADELKLGYLPSKYLIIHLFAIDRFPLRRASMACKFVGSVEGILEDSKTEGPLKRQTWMLLEPEGKLGNRSIQLIESSLRDHPQNKPIGIRFSAKVFDEDIGCWALRKVVVKIQRKDIQLVKGSQTEVMMTDGAGAISLQAAIQIKNALGLGTLPGECFKARASRSLLIG